VRSGFSLQIDGTRTRRLRSDVRNPKRAPYDISGPLLPGILQICPFRPLRISQGRTSKRLRQRPAARIEAPRIGSLHREAVVPGTSSRSTPRRHPICLNCGSSVFLPEVRGCERQPEMILSDDDETGRTRRGLISQTCSSTDAHVTYCRAENTEPRRWNWTWVDCMKVDRSAGATWWRFA
jgi:hypothetical protein